MSSSPATPRPAGPIAIVDDEPENLNVLEALLSHAGYSVVLFPRGELALAAALEEPPALVLLDIRMPGLSGYEVCRRFKAEDRLKAIPIIFISALSASADISAGFECGGVDYIAKPFRESEVLARVRAHLALHEAYAKLAEQHARLATLERQRDTLVHMLVHDMRSPLQAILGHLQLVEASSARLLQADDLDSLRTAISGTRLLTRMVSTVIDLSRMETSEIPLRPETIAVRHIFQAACAQTANPANHHRIIADIAASCALLRCDVDLTVRIVANLLANALKYSPDDREIIFGARPDPSGVRLWVRDRGPGIPARDHQRIFEKFGVAAHSSGKRSSSTGLGLAFCKLAVEAQGGSIGIESESGKGSSFWFTLPAATAPLSGVD
jgi:signal transduction histidine kinase